jgi:N-methylhydantoinase A
MRVGVEVGGTFTDLVAVEDGRLVVTKVPSTPKSPDVGAFAALTTSGIDLARIEDLGHGSTVATNAVLERKGATVAFVATAGFRDLLFMQRHDRRNIYDLFYAKPAPPVRRKDCFEAVERLSADGSVETPLDEAKVKAELLPALEAGGYRAVAICLLNAYADPVHEKRLAALIAEALPGVLVTCSHQVAREFREFEDPALGLCAAGDRRLPAPLREQARRGGLQGPLHRDAVQRRTTACRGDAPERDHGALFRSRGRRRRRHAPGSPLRIQGPHHLRHGRHLDRCLPGAG